MSKTKTERVTRTKLHTRSIQCEGFQRSDDLWDIEAALLDTKTSMFTNHERGELQPGEAIHNMLLRVTLDLDMVIKDIHVEMPFTPFGICKHAAEKMRDLIGIQIGAGWMREVRQRIPRTDSCTHVVELLGPISTTAYQTMHWAIEERANAQPQRQTPAILNQCRSLASDSAVVKVMWPEFYTGD